jgi:hypothetical protein
MSRKSGYRFSEEDMRQRKQLSGRKPVVPSTRRDAGIEPWRQTALQPTRERGPLVIIGLGALIGEFGQAFLEFSGARLQAVGSALGVIGRRAVGFRLRIARRRMIGAAHQEQDRQDSDQVSHATSPSIGGDPIVAGHCFSISKTRGAPGRPR